MMIACLLSPRKYETTAVAASSPSTALRFRTGQPIGGGVEPPQHIRKWSRSNPCGGHRRSTYRSSRARNSRCLDGAVRLHEWFPRSSVGGYRAAVSNTFNAPVSAALPNTS
jgi:hypothetical protein